MSKNTINTAFCRAPFIAANLLLSCSFPLWMSELIHWAWLLALFISSLLVFFIFKEKNIKGIALHALILTLGMSLFTYQAMQYQNSQLSFIDANKRFTMEVKIIDFAKTSVYKNQTSVSFSARLMNSIKDKKGRMVLRAGTRINLACYSCLSQYELGEVWSMSARVKPPKGAASWGAFDFEKYALANGIVATGYFQEKKAIKLSDSRNWFERFRHSAKKVLNVYYLQTSNTDPTNETKLALESNANIEFSKTANVAILQALLLGDKTLIDKQHWTLFRQTGTSHLMAISGLHITLVYFLSSFLLQKFLSSFLWIMPAKVSHFLIDHFFIKISIQASAMLGGLFFAIFYGLISGFTIPTQRAVFMLLVTCLCFLLNKRIQLVDALSVALILLLIFFPLSTLHNGFWLSFLAVMIITVLIKTQERTWLIQVRLALAMIPIALLVFDQVAVVSPIANLLVIPLVSILILPLSIVLLLLSMLVEPDGIDSSSTLINIAKNTAAKFLEFAWQFINAVLDLVWWLLQYFSAWHESFQAYIPKLSITSSMTILCLYGMCLVVVWRFVLFRQLMVLPLLLFFLPTTADKTQGGEFSLTTLDVGQGLALMIETQHHKVIVDTGNLFADSDSAESVILPYLNRSVNKPIHTIVVSHADQDHIGGLATMREYAPTARILINNPQTPLIDNFVAQGDDSVRPLANISSCYARKWILDGVKFQIFDKVSSERTGLSKRNNRSCVLKVSSVYGSALLPGDIERVAEHLLVAKYYQQLSADVLIAAHHGSKTSSTPVLLNQVRPSISVISAAYFSSYGHPHPEVLKRLHKYSKKVLSTAWSGSIQIFFSKQGIQTTEYRAINPRFWYSGETH